MTKLIGIVGWKNSGKTTLIERLVARFTGDGLRVATIKHAHHDFDIDHPGKDSWRHRHAGAREVLITSQRRWALLHENEGETEPTLGDLLARLSPADLVIVEGFKQHDHPKIEVVLAPPRERLLCENDAAVVAVATNMPELVLARSLPRLDIDRPDVVADFIRKLVNL
ncbi:MAG: molybdopterin-guanine dinucleotide biosynthesis protein B [Pseudomonadota bacterium]|nr:molybdopterin-guanine dinucleotide biosynthesis protein B [Pseudomonadota bacterium]